MLFAVDGRLFLSTPSARRATYNGSMFTKSFEISIHALREEGDVFRDSLIIIKKISIHALREEGDTRPSPVTCAALKFLSTPSARRATRLSGQCQYHRAISIHALREEGDLDAGKATIMANLFLSTPSARRATGEVFHLVLLSAKFLSTPSARRATELTSRSYEDKDDFYPRPPRGGRRLDLRVWRCLRIFLSTPSARRATHPRRRVSGGAGDFYPRPPRGGRPGCSISSNFATDFYPRPPRGGRQDPL